MVADATIATAVVVAITASLPFYLYGAWIMIDAEIVTWAVLVRHLTFILIGLVLTTVPVVTWMVPRLLDRLTGLSGLHAILGMQAYALLVFALSGIVRIFQAKYEADLYNDPDPEADIGDLHPDMGAWRMRLRIGVFGYVLFWFGAYLLGVAWYVTRYLL